MLIVLFNLLNFLFLNQISNQEYLFLIGIVIAFFGLIASIILSFKNILKIFKKLQFKKKYIVYFLIILLLFVMLELIFIKPIQRVFFDDVIYQSGSLFLLHTGQTIMCNYGTPFNCFSGQLFHEPIGTSFSLALGFGLFGINRITAYYSQLILAGIGIFCIFLISFILFKNIEISIFTSFIFAINPTLLVWAQPTTSDLEMMVFSLIAILFMLIFIKQKNIKTFSMFGFSLALVTYMKIDAILYLLIIPLMYLLLDNKNILTAIKNNLKSIVKLKNSIYIDFLIILLIIAIVPSLIFTYNQFKTAPFGFEHSKLQNSCNSNILTPHSKFSIEYFKYNICSNIYFWFNEYANKGIVQPLIFTIFSIIGILFSIIYKKREFIAISIWFLVFFGLYTSFYAGAVTYGSDWRFMLSLIAQSSIFAGIGIFCILFIIKNFIKDHYDK